MFKIVAASGRINKREIHTDFNVYFDLEDKDGNRLKPPIKLIDLEGADIKFLSLNKDGTFGTADFNNEEIASLQVFFC